MKNQGLEDLTQTNLLTLIDKRVIKVKLIKGKLTVVTGPMFAGKTTFLLNQINKIEALKLPYIIFKPSIDDRYALDAISSHDGKTKQSENIELKPTLYFPLPQHIFFDEIQFFDFSLLPMIRELVQKGHHITLSGLEKDYLGHAFGIIPEIIKELDVLIRLEGACALCNKSSTNTFRKTQDLGLIVLGSSDQYMSLCHECYSNESNK